MKKVLLAVLWGNLLCTSLLFSQGKAYKFTAQQEGIYFMKFDKPQIQQHKIVTNGVICYIPYTDTVNNRIYVYATPGRNYQLQFSDTICKMTLPSFVTNTTKREEKIYKYKLSNTTNESHWLSSILTFGETYTASIDELPPIIPNQFVKASIQVYNFEDQSDIVVDINGVETKHHLLGLGDHIIDREYPPTSQFTKIKITNRFSGKVGVIQIESDCKERIRVQTDICKIYITDKYVEAPTNIQGDKISFSLDGSKLSIGVLNSTDNRRRLIAEVERDRTQEVIPIEIESVSIEHKDYVVVADTKVFKSASNLIRVLQKRDIGTTFALVDVESIYDKFSNSNPSPYAIKEYLHIAKPAYAILVGDATNSVANRDNLMPVFSYIQTNLDNKIETDYPYCYDSDPAKPTIAVGRIPVKNELQFRNYISKLSIYLNAKERTSAIIFDDYALLTFNKDTLGSRNTIHVKSQNGNYTLAEQVIGFAFGTLDVPKVINKYQPKYFEYVGHASIAGWSNAYKTRLHHMRALRKGNVFLQIEICCSTGKFTNTQNEGFSEELIRLKNKGPVATITPTGYSRLSTYQAVSDFIIKHKEGNTIGVLLNELKKNLFDKGELDIDEVMNFTLLGVPSL